MDGQCQWRADKLVGTRTTSTINGQPGTYYFRTDDPDVIGGDGEPAFVDNASYVLVFKPGDTLTLAGPHADHPGFAAWRGAISNSPRPRFA